MVSRMYIYYAVRWDRVSRATDAIGSWVIGNSDDFQRLKCSRDNSMDSLRNSISRDFRNKHTMDSTRHDETTFTRTPIVSELVIEERIPMNSNYTNYFRLPTEVLL